MPVQAIEYDANTEVLAIEHFQYVEDAIAWCEERKGAKLHLGDTEFGYVLMTEDETENMAKSQWPDKWYEVHGAEDDGTIRYLEEEDHKDGQFKDNGEA
jgi:hypothetical protein